MRVRVLSPAIDEIVEAAFWFDGKRAGLGAEFWRLPRFCAGYAV